MSATISIVLERPSRPAKRVRYFATARNDQVMLMFAVLARAVGTEGFEIVPTTVAVNGRWLRAFELPPELHERYAKEILKAVREAEGAV